MLEWWNLLFLLPLFFSAVLLIVNALGLSGSESDVTVESEADIDSGTVVEAGADVDTETEIEADAEGDAEAAASHSHDAQHADHVEQVAPSGASRLFLEFLGVGRIPITLVFQIFFFSWGIAGWILNRILQPALGDPLLFIWVSIAGAFLISSMITRTSARLIGKYFPLSETYAKGREELIGCEGEAIYSITRDSGMAQVYDETGTLHSIYCRVEPDDEMIEKGSQLLIIDYDDSGDFYIVKQSPVPVLRSEARSVSRDLEKQK